MAVNRKKELPGNCKTYLRRKVTKAVKGIRKHGSNYKKTTEQDLKKIREEGMEEAGEEGMRYDEWCEKEFDKKIEINESDREFLANILNQHHYNDNGMDIKECGLNNCWYKMMVKKLGCPHYLKGHSKIKNKDNIHSKKQNDTSKPKEKQNGI